MICKATKTALLSAVVLSAAFVAQGASAAMIQDWNYSVDSGFSSYTDTDGNSGASSAITPSGSGLNGDPTSLSWGVSTGGGQSSISIESPVTGTVDTNGSAAPGATFDHDNKVITSSSKSLASFNLQTQLTLNSITPPGVNPTPLGLTFNSFFTETPNVAGTCAAPGGPPCSDIFVLSNAGDYPSGGVFTNTFTNDDYLYTVALNINGLGTLSDAECSAANAATGCVGFTTEENTDNTFNTSFTISARAVPEPGSLAMLGLGLSLIGFGFYARRRNFRA